MDDLGSDLLRGYVVPRRLMCIWRLLQVLVEIPRLISISEDRLDGLPALSNGPLRDAVVQSPVFESACRFVSHE